jgi:hypothetical protein
MKNWKAMAIRQTYLMGLLLELLNCSPINTTTFVNKVSSGSGFSRVYVSNDNDVDMNLLLSHDGLVSSKNNNNNSELLEH